MLSALHISEREREVAAMCQALWSALEALPTNTITLHLLFWF